MPSRRRGRPAKLNKHEEQEGATKNNGKHKRKQVEVMDSSHSDSPINLSHQSDSWECPASYRKHSIPDSMMISSRRASLRSAKRLTEIEMPSVSRCSYPLKSREQSFATDVFQQPDDPVEAIIISAYQAPECSLQSPSRYLSPVVNPSTLTPEMRREETEKVGNYVAPERFTVDIPVMEEIREAEISIPNHLNQMEGPNTFQAKCIPLEQEPLAEDIQASNNFEERTNNNHSKSISMVGHPSRSFSLNLTEMINMWNDEEDEVNSAGQSSAMDTGDRYQVKPESMPILRKVLCKNGDIAKNCTVLTIKYRSMLLEMICDIIRELQDKDFSKLKEGDLQDMIALVNDIKSIKVDTEWLHQRLVEILEARQILKQSGMLKEKKESNRKVIENVDRELKEYEEEKRAMAAKLQSIYEKETVCKETLARARDESTRITATISDAKSKVKRFLNCSLVDGLL